MTALHQLIAWSVLFKLAVLCAQPPNPVPFAELYAPCEAGTSGFNYLYLSFLGQFGQGHPIVEHNFPDLDDVNFNVGWRTNLDYQNAEGWMWLNRITSLVAFTFRMIEHALVRLHQLRGWIAYAAHVFALPVEWQATETSGFLNQCIDRLSQRIDEHHEFPHLVEANPQIFAMVSEDPEPNTFENYYESCLEGVKGLIAINAPPNDNDNNLDVWPYNFPELENLIPQSQVPWLNKMMRAIIKTSDVLHIAIERLNTNISWFNLAIVDTHDENRNLPVTLNQRRNALGFNARLAQCSRTLLRFVMQPPNTVSVFVVNPEQIERFNIPNPMQWLVQHP